MKIICVCFYIVSFDITFIPLSYADGPFTMITYPDLPSDYLDFKFDFEEKEYSDPFLKKANSSMIEDCQNLRDATLYSVVADVKSDNKTYPARALDKLSSFDLKRGKKGLKYEAKEVKIRESDPDAVQDDVEDKYHRVNMFRCATSLPDEYLYLSYGFHDELEFMYVFKDTPQTSDSTAVETKTTEIEFVGRVERKPVLFSGFRTVKDVKRVFLNVVNNLKGAGLPFYPKIDDFQPPNDRGCAIGLPVSFPVEEDVLCSLNANQQFRLCSLIDDARSPASTGSVRWIEKNMLIHRCTDRKLIYLGSNGEKEGKPSQYRIEQIYVNIIPCFDEQSPKFFLTADPSDRTAVFTLMSTKSKKANGNASSTVMDEDEYYFVPDGLYKNVSVLKYRTEVY